jgi:hypothetical protein
MKGFALTVLALAAVTATSRAHDLERTRVTLTFSEDGAFVLDVANDPNWLLLRLESFNPSTRARSLRAGQELPTWMDTAVRDARIAALAPVMVDRVVLWVDGREVRPDSAEYLPADSTFRLRGRMPLEARSLRWLYGSVGDPYPLIVRRADGRTLTEIIEGSNWSGTLDLSGQFKSSRFAGVDHIVWLVGLFATAMLIRLVTSARTAGSDRREL